MPAGALPLPVGSALPAPALSVVPALPAPAPALSAAPAPPALAPPTRTLLTLESEKAPWAVTDAVLLRELEELRALQAVAPAAHEPAAVESAASETAPAADAAGTAAPAVASATASAADVAAAAAAAKRRARELKRLGDALSAGRCATRWWRAPEA